MTVPLTPRIYTLDPDETAEWRQEGPDGEEAREFLKRAISANEPAGRHIEVYASDKRLLASFNVA